MYRPKLKRIPRKAAYELALNAVCDFVCEAAGIDGEDLGYFFGDMTEKQAQHLVDFYYKWILDVKE